MFRLQDGLIHFVFCNEDEYLLDSLIRLNLTDELHYLLTRQGYQGIYFVAGQENTAEVQMLDPQSDAYFPYKWMEGLLRTEFRQQRTLDNLGAAELGKRIAALLTDHRRRNAVVFRSLEDFAALTSESPALRDALCGERTATRDSIVVLLTRPKASTCLSALTGSGSVFALRDYAMCPELKHVVGSGSGDLFQDLKDQLKDRCVFLNELSEERIHTLLESWILFSNAGVTATEQEIEDTAWLIYTWYHSEEMQLDKTFARLLPENPEGSLSKLRDSLPKAWKKLTAQLAAIRQSCPEEPVRQILARCYPVRYRCPVEADTRLAQQVQRLMRRALENHLDAAFGVERETLLDLERSYTAFYSREPAEMMKWLLLRCVERGEESIAQGDRETFLRCVKLLSLAHAQKLQWPEDEEQEAGWKSWNTLLEYSRMWFHTGRQLRQAELRIAEQEKLCAAREAEARQRREEGFREDSVVLQNIRRGIEDCRERIGRLRENNNQTAAFRQSLNKDLATLEYYAENFCSTVSSGQLAKLRADAEQAMDRMKQTQNHYRDYMDSHTDRSYAAAEYRERQESVLDEGWTLDY